MDFSNCAIYCNVTFINYVVDWGRHHQIQADLISIFENVLDGIINKISCYFKYVTFVILISVFDVVLC